MNDVNINKQVIDSNFINCIINNLVEIKELESFFSSLKPQKTNNLLELAYFYYKNNNNENKKELEKEIKRIIKECRYNGRNKKMNYIEILMDEIISSIKFHNLFNLEKQIIEWCQNCKYNKSKEFGYSSNKLNYSAFHLDDRINNGNIVKLTEFFIINDFLDECKKCHQKTFLCGSKSISIPKIYIIILLNNEKKKKSNFS